MNEKGPEGLPKKKPWVYSEEEKRVKKDRAWRLIMEAAIEKHGAELAETIQNFPDSPPPGYDIRSKKEKEEELLVQEKAVAERTKNNALSQPGFGKLGASYPKSPEDTRRKKTNQIHPLPQSRE